MPIPLLNLAVSGVVSAVIALLFDLEKLVEFMSIGTLLAYTIVSASVIILRYKPEQTTNEKTSKDADEISTATETSQADILGPSTSFCKLKPKYWWLMNVGGGCKSEKIISNSVLIFTCCCAVLSIILHFFASQLLDGNLWIMFLLIFFTIFALGCLFVIGAHQQNPSSNTFRVPWVPVLPGLSIFFNIGLMVHLNALTWVRFAVWMTLGLLVYFLYGINHSKEGNQGNAYSMLITSSEAGKEPWGSMEARENVKDSKTIGDENLEAENPEVMQSDQTN